MNICYLSRTFLQAKGGIETDIFNLARILSAQGHTIHIITAEGEEKYAADFPSGTVHIHKLKHRFEPFKGSWLLDRQIPFLDFRYSKAVARLLEKLINEYTIDIVQSPDWLYEGYYFSKAKRNIPLVVRLHGHISVFEYYQFRTIARTPRNRMNWRYEKELVLNADALLANALFYVRFMEKNWNVILSNVEIISNAVNTECLFPAQENTSGKRKVLYVGRLEENKGVGVLAEAIPLVSKEIPDVEFIFVGLNKMNEKAGCTWRDYIKQKTGGCAVTFVDPVDSEVLARFYQESTVCVVPSIFETLATVVLEAMACGKPIIATTVGGFPEVIQDGANGMLIEPGNAQVLAFAIKTLLNDSSMRQRLGANARRTIEERFSLEKIAEKTVRFYQKTIDEFQGRMNRA